MHGVAYDAKILPIRLFDANGVGAFTDSELAAAIDHAIANGAMVMNNSWGSSTSITAVTRQQVLDAIPQQVGAWGRAVDNDVVVVFAAGNNARSQPSVRSGLPFHFPELQNLWLAVMAVDLNGNEPFYTNRCGVAAACENGRAIIPH